VSTTFHRRIRDWRFTALIVVGVVTWYPVTVGIVPGVFRHTGDGGRLQWLLSVPGAMPFLRAY